MSTTATNPAVVTIMQRRLLTKGRFYHSTPNNNNYFLITFKIVQDNPNYYSNDNDPDDNLNYDHEFFYQYFTVDYHIRCKFIPHLVVLDLLNCEFDVNTLNNEPSLSPQQRLNLEKSLEFILFLRVSKETVIETIQN